MIAIRFVYFFFLSFFFSLFVFLSELVSVLVHLKEGCSRMPVKRERTRENARVVLMIEVEQEEKGVQKMKRRGQERQYKRQDKLRGKEYDSS